MNSGQRVREYVLEQQVGEGGMGEVWLARHSLLDTIVAIKVMTSRLIAAPEFESRFLQEAKAQAKLQHPRIVTTTNFFVENGLHYLIMPYLEGRSVEHRLRGAAGPLPVNEAVRISRDVLTALDHAHQKGIIHRDVKPSNILLDGDGNAYLTDFGIALMVGHERKTRTGMSLGTPHYMSPEQIRRPQSVDHRSDVYSVGCVLYEMLTGHPPFEVADDDVGSDFAVKEAHIGMVPRSPREMNPSVPAWLDDAILRALAKEPDDRFGGCGEFERALAGAGRAVPGGSAREVPRPAPTGFLRRTTITTRALILVCFAFPFTGIRGCHSEPNAPPKEYKLSGLQLIAGAPTPIKAQERVTPQPLVIAGFFMVLLSLGVVLRGGPVTRLDAGLASAGLAALLVFQSFAEDILQFKDTAISTELGIVVAVLLSFLSAALGWVRYSDQAALRRRANGRLEAVVFLATACQWALPFMLICLGVVTDARSTVFGGALVGAFALTLVIFPVGFAGHLVVLSHAWPAVGKSVSPRARWKASLPLFLPLFNFVWVHVVVRAWIRAASPALRNGAGEASELLRLSLAYTVWLWLTGAVIGMAIATSQGVSLPLEIQFFAFEVTWYVTCLLGFVVPARWAQILNLLAEPHA